MIVLPSEADDLVEGVEDGWPEDKGVELGRLRDTRHAVHQVQQVQQDVQLYRTGVIQIIIEMVLVFRRKRP
jgi:hypothetical protein